MARGGRPASADWSSRFSCSLKFDLGTWIVVSPCARTATIQIANIFENLDVPGFNFMRNYVLAIPNWPNVPRCSQSFAFSPGALWFSWYYYIVIDDILYFPDRVSLWKPAEAGTNRARTEKLRGLKLWTVEKTRKKHGFGGFWNEISPESNSPQLPEHLSRISDGIFTQTRYVDVSTELGESIGSG